MVAERGHFIHLENFICAHEITDLRAGNNKQLIISLSGGCVDNFQRQELLHDQTFEIKNAENKVLIKAARLEKRVLAINSAALFIAQIV